MKIKGDLSDLKKQLDDFDTSSRRYNKSESKMMNSADNNNGMASDTSLSNFGSSIDTLTSMTGKLSEALKQSINTLSQAQKNPTTNASDLNQLNQFIKQATSVLSKNAQSMGNANAPIGTRTVNNTAGRVYTENVQSRINNASVAREARTYRQNTQAGDRALGSSIHNARARVRNLSGSFETAQNTGYVTYNKNQENLNRYIQTKQTIADAKAKLATRTEKHQTRLSSTQAEISRLSNLSETERTPDTQKTINLYSKQADALQDSINRLEAFQDELDKSSDQLKASKNAYAKSVDSGATKVGAQKGTFAAFMQERGNSMALAASSAGMSAIQSGYSKGNQARMSSQQDIDSITLASVASGRGGYQGRKADNSLLNNLATRGVRNGTGYDATTMAGFAGAYTAGTGNTTGSVKVADAMSRLSRYGGLGTDTTNQLMTLAGATGGVSNARDVSSISNIIQGSAVRNGMAAKASEQGTALASILSTLQGQKLSNNQIGEVSALQGVIGKGNKQLQGQNGANAIQGLYNATTQGFNDPILRAGFASGNASYAGASGAAKQQLAMMEPNKHPQEMANMIKNYTKMNTAGKAGTELMLAQNGMTPDQAKAMTNLALEGKLDKKNLDKELNKDKSGGKTAANKTSKQFSIQGDSTLDIKVALDTRGNISASQTMDSGRKLSNSAGGALPGLASFGGSVLGSVGGSLLTSLGGGALKGGLGSLLGKSSLGKKVLNSKLGTKIFGTGVKAAGEAGEEVAAGGGLLAKFKNTKLGANAVKGLKFAKGKGTGLLAKGAELGSTALKSAKGLFSTSGGKKVAGEAGGKVLGKLGLKAGAKTLGKFAGPIGWAWAGVDAIRGAGDIAKDPMNAIKHPLKSVGSLLGLTRVNEDKPGIFDSKDKKSKKGLASKAKSSKVVKDLDSLLKGFNDMLSRAEVVIAEAKGIKGGSDKDSSDSGSGTGEDSKQASGVKKSAAKWKDDILKAAKQMGQKISDDKLQTLIKLIQNESGGDAGITGIDDHDGTGAAKGLLQFKDSTFKNYAVKGHTDIFNGYDQLLAFFNNSNWKSDIGIGYNGKDGEWRGQASGPSGHRINAKGGLYRSEGLTKISEAGQPEMVLPLGAGNEDRARSLMSQAQGIMGTRLQDPHANKQATSNNMTVSPSYNINITTGAQGSELEQLKATVQNLMAESTQKMKATFSNNSLQGAFSQNMNY